MVVIIRQKTEMPDGSEVVAKKYVSSFDPITGELRRKGKENDAIIHESVRNMERDLVVSHNKLFVLLFAFALGFFNYLVGNVPWYRFIMRKTHGIRTSTTSN